jgi:SAM-dependent methyltransferase
VREAVGIDLRLALFAPEETGESTRALVWKVLQSEQARRRFQQPASADPLPAGTFRASRPMTIVKRDQWIPSEARDPEQAIREALAGLPVRLAQMDATRLDFADASFDWLLSRSAMEHIRPVKLALAEMARVVRPGGLIYLSIDPFFWVRGCHKRGVVDIPFAHARLTLAEYRRFVCEREGDSLAEKRCQRLETLNRFTLPQWREMIEAQPWDILDWNEEHSRIGEEVLEQSPDILDTLLPGVDKRDLVHERIRVWLRKRS